MDNKLHTRNQPITLLWKNENKNKNNKTNREKARKE